MTGAGNMMVFGEMAGLADVGSPDHEREWARLLREKAIVLPAKERS